MKRFFAIWFLWWWETFRELKKHQEITVQDTTKMLCPAPSLHWQLNMSMLKLNVKRAPVMSVLFLCGHIIMWTSDRIRIHSLSYWYFSDRYKFRCCMIQKRPHCDKSHHLDLNFLHCYTLPSQMWAFWSCMWDLLFHIRISETYAFPESLCISIKITKV